MLKLVRAKNSQNWRNLFEARKLEYVAVKMGKLKSIVIIRISDSQWPVSDKWKDENELSCPIILFVENCIQYCSGVCIDSW